MMSAIGFTLVGFALMEFAGWFIHKYLMHGPLWGIHKTHHQHTEGPFEWNDLFSLLFGSVAVLLIFLGVAEFDYRFWLGIGISLYGMSYFFLHDMLIHRRVKWFKRPKKGYLAGIFKAHQAHHATNKRDGSVSFGLFVVPKRYFKRSE
ncbi:sterol desaturase family protein [Lunatimonas salinarum]|uniref:sterol desaturase family protein n=1 Tax=Lunatimonas salinarum TaxID=1774590 RepID=UPI001ADEFF63|nr:sterol desaturase family protein [Lunatimonas salinarum]